MRNARLCPQGSWMPYRSIEGWQVTLLLRMDRGRFIPEAMNVLCGSSEPDLDELLTHSTGEEHA